MHGEERISMSVIELSPQITTFDWFESTRTKRLADDVFNGFAISLGQFIRKTAIASVL